MEKTSSKEIEKAKRELADLKERGKQAPYKHTFKSADSFGQDSCYCPFGA